MSRSIHSTHNEYRRERAYRYTDGDAQHVRLEAIRERIQKKRRIKSQVRDERGRLPLADLPPVAVDAIPVNIIEQGKWIHYPASPADLQCVMGRLPVGVLTGLSGIRLCLGGEYQEEGLTSEERAEAERDPWIGRVGCENLPGVFGGRILGTYWTPARIDLYAYVYDSALLERATWEIYLRLRMLSTFVHEVAHHEDYMRRDVRGRWRMDNMDKAEDFAEATAAIWVKECVVPYVEEAYPDAVRNLNAWVEHNGGTAVPLALLAGDWRWDTDGKAASVCFGSAKEAFVNLVRNVHEGGERTATRLQFARDLHYGENYPEALSVIGRVLKKQPANLEALTLQADIFEHQGESGKAETLAQQVVNQDENYVDAWMVLADVHEAQGDWSQLVVTAARGISATDDTDWRRGALLAHRARANLELGNYANVVRDLESLSETLGGERTAASLRAVLLLRTGHYEEAFRLADSHVVEKLWTGRAVFIAVRFEAAHKLGWSDKAGELSAEVLNVLRRNKFGDWVDQLASEYSL